MANDLKDILSGFPCIDYGDLSAYSFDVIKTSSNEYNLIIDFVYIDDEKFNTEYGFSIRTSLYTDEIVNLASNVTKLLDIGLFDNLVFLPQANCFDIDGNVLFDFDWGDYFNNDVLVN